MKNLIFTVVAVVAVLGFVATSFGDTNASAVSHVRVTVNPNVAVQAVDSEVDAGTVQSGCFNALIHYTVDANSEQVAFFVEASPLYKGNDPLGTEVLPIPLDLSKGICLIPANGNAMGGHGNNLAYLGDGADACGFPTQVTEQVAFESSQNNHFSQDVSVIVTWNQNDAEKPQGEYSGAVRLSALLLPAPI